MARLSGQGDLLGTIAGCLAAFGKQAASAGITLELAAPTNPALLHGDTRALDQLGRNLLSYAIRRVERGHRLLVRLDVRPDESITLELDEAGARDAKLDKSARPADQPAGFEPARAIVDAAGGELVISETQDGRLHLLATLPGRMGKPAIPSQ